MTSQLPHALRSDARDNRELILEAARALFATGGLNVPMREIARRAGVGPATLYRRFPTKEMLVTEALAGQMRACHAIVDEGLAEPDPWPGLNRSLLVDGAEVAYAPQHAWPLIACPPHLPATAAPIGRTRGGLPIGVQIIGPYLEDLTTIGFAERLSAEFGLGAAVARS